MPDLSMDSERLYTIPGNPPNLAHYKQGDPFYIRNEFALNIDKRVEPPMFELSETHFVASWLMHEKAPKVTMPEVLKQKLENMRREAGIHE